MAVYNGEPYISKTIESVLRQDFIDYELIIVDDCSTDRTKAIIDSYDDRRIKYYKNQKNLGQTKSLNVGLSKSIGKYIARIDADDIYYPQKLGIQYYFLENNANIVACGTGSDKIDKEGNKIGLRNPPTSHSEIVATMLYRSPMIHISIMIRRKNFIECGGYNEAFPVCADYDLWYRLIINNYQMANIPKILTCHRQFSGSLGNRKYLDESISEVVTIIYNFWTNYVNIPITREECNNIALMRWPESRLTLSQMCSAFIKIAQAQKRLNKKSYYFDKVSLDTYKLLLWGIVKSNFHNKKEYSTIKMVCNNFGLLYQYINHPITTIIIIISFIVSLFPTKIVYVLKKSISS